MENKEPLLTGIIFQLLKSKKIFYMEDKYMPMFYMLLSAI